MPYNPDNPPDEIRRKLPKEKQRKWCEVFNSVFDKTKSDEKAFQTAWRVVKKSSCNCDVDRGCGGNCGCFGQLIGPSESEGSIADATRNQDVLNAKELLVLARILISGE
jgi:cation transport regulator ChaB